MWLLRRVGQFIGWFTMFLIGYLLFSDLVRRMIQRGQELTEAS